MKGFPDFNKISIMWNLTFRGRGGIVTETIRMFQLRYLWQRFINHEVSGVERGGQPTKVLLDLHN